MRSLLRVNTLRRYRAAANTFSPHQSNSSRDMLGKKALPHNNDMWGMVTSFSFFPSSMFSSNCFDHSNQRRPELMRVLLPHTTALSACLDGLSPAKPVVYDISLATAGYTGEVPCGKPPSHWTILRALASGRAWSRRGAPSTKLPHSGHRSNDQDSRHGCGTSATIMSSGGDKDSACNEPSCLCYTSGTTSTGSAAASRALGFTCGSSDLEGKSGASGGGTTGVARPLPIRGSGRKVAAEWTERFGEMDMQPNGVTWSGTNGNRTAATWGRICEDIHVRIRR